MNKISKILMTTLATIVISASATTFAATTQTAPTTEPAVKIAIVDVPKVVDSSSQVATLKKAQEARAKEMVKFVEKARLAIAAESDAKKKANLEEKYNKELKAKQEAIKKDYTAKLEAIDKSISQQINNIAKSNGYTIVIAKSMVLYGGDDITDKVIKAVK